jgi:N-acetyl-alpha-D-glucosaminyl L-malate synthase BshA
MVCYASLGGSGVVATELARALASRGHDIHLISSERPFRWQEGVRGLTFHAVTVPSYPLFREPQYLLALANTIARVSDQQHLDVVHAHYAVPHATAAYLSSQILAASSRNERPRTVTTLHGTDITLVGSDRSYARVVAFSIEQSDIVTAVSQSLRADTIASLGVRHPIDVIPNFLDCHHYRRRPDSALRTELGFASDDAVMVHMSNFRPVKRVDAVLEVFRLARREVRPRLLLIGDGPDRPDIERRVDEYGLAADVRFIGEAPDPVRWLSIADLFLLPSSQESFGLAALEAMACEVPVIASNVGGLPEIIEDGVTGFVCAPEAVGQMARRCMDLVRDHSKRAAMGRAAAARVRESYCTPRVVPLYEQAYERAVGQVAGPA